MPNEQFVTTLQVRVEGSPLPADVAALMTYALVEDSRSAPDQFRLRFDDPARIALAKSGLKIGAKVRLLAQPSDSASPELLLSGEVTSVSAEWEQTGSVTEVCGYDHGHRLMRGRRVAAYAHMTIADIVGKVAERAKLDKGQIDDVTDFAGKEETQLSQDNISDWDFLQRLAAAVGAECAVVDGALEFRVPKAPADAPAATASAHNDPYVLGAGQNLISLRATVTAAEQVSKVQVRGWDYENKQAVVGNADAKTLSTELPDVTPAKLAALFDSPDLVAAGVPYRTATAAQAAATALADRIAGVHAEVDGVARGNAKLRANTPVTLAGVGKPFEGKYTLTSTRHVFSPDGYRTSFVASGRADRSLYGTIHGGERRTAPAGLVIGVVSDLNDKLKLGRVKVTFPWLSDDYVSGWARVVQLGVGKDTGVLTLPTVGQEVLVGFELGHFDAPYILGTVANGKDKLPKPEVDLVDANGTLTGYHVYAPGGHLLSMIGAGSGANQVKLATGDGKHSVLLDQKGASVAITAGGKVTIHGDGKITIEGKGVTVDAGSSPLELKGSQVTIKANSVKVG
jgi:uncharacterized protein involved in type VI secretion and phage assembly